MAELPNPERIIDSIHGQLPKVFIVYPHNPQVYQWEVTPIGDLQLHYPQYSLEQLRQIQKDEKKDLKRKEEERINNHNILVYEFAQFLRSHKITVAFEGLLVDYNVPNYMRWFQDQMKDSDYIIFVITDSFCHFLANKPPEDKERIFAGEFLHTFVNNPKKSILPIFLGRPRKLDLLPDALRAAKTYHIVCNRERPYFRVEQQELDRLYAVLTKQNRIQPPAQVSRVPIVPGLQRRGARPKPLLEQRHHQMYTSLVGVRRPLTAEEETNLSEKPGFAIHWSALASELGFGAAEIERIRDVDHYDAERCIQLLRSWRQREPNATVSRLVEGIYKIQNAMMLEILYGIFF